MLRRRRRIIGLDRLRGALHGTEENVSVAPFHAGHAIGRAVRCKVLGKAHQELAAEVRVGDFAAAELHHSLHAIAFLQKANGVILLEVVIVIVGIGAEFQLLYLHHMLLFLGFVLLLFLFVLIMAVVNRLGDRR